MLHVLRLSLCAALVGTLCGCAVRRSIYDYDSAVLDDAGGSNDAARVNDAAASSDAAGSNDAGVLADGAADASEPFVATRKYPGPCSETHEYTSGSQTIVVLYTYDENEQLTERLSHGETNEYLAREFFDFDEHGRMTLLRIDGQDNGTIDSEMRFTYDEAGRLVLKREITYVSTSEQREWTYRYEYDEDGHRIGMTLTNPDSEVVWIETYTPGPNGPIEMMRTRPPHEAMTRITWSYYEDGRERTHEEYDYSSGWRLRRTLSYNERGDISFALFDQSGGTGPYDYRETYEYDSFGNLLVIDMDGGPGTSVLNRVTYTYECFADE